MKPGSGDAAIRRNDSLNGGTAPGSRTGSAAVRDEKIDLASLLEAVFDPVADRLIYEVLDFGGTRRQSASPLLAPRNGAATDRVPSRPMYRTPGTGLLTALGCVDARLRIGGRQWVVLTCDEGLSPAMQTLLEARAADSLRRFVLILRIDMEPSRSNGTHAVTGLLQAGWRVHRAAESANMDELRHELRAMTMVDDTPVLVLVSRSGTQLPPAPPDACSPSVRSIPGEIERELVDELLRVTVTDRRVVPVIAVDCPPWSRLIAEAPEKCVAVVPDEVETSMTWCAALADSGCHPVIVLTPGSLHHQRPAITRELSLAARTATLIVTCEPSSRGDTDDSEGTLQIPCLVGANLRTPRSGIEAAEFLEQSFRSGGTSVLWLPDVDSREPADGRGAVEEASEQADSAPSVEPVTKVGRASEGIVNLFGGSAQTIVPPDAGEVRFAAAWRGELRLRPYVVSPETAQSDQQAIRSKSLRPDVWRWLNEYNHVGLRDLYLWRWCLHGIELTTFPGVPGEWLSDVHDTKLLSVILCVLFDDVADRRGRTEFLELLLEGCIHAAPIDTADLTEPERQYFEITRRLWNEYESRIRRYPQSAEYARLLKFDLMQFLNTMRYAHLVNAEPGLLSPTEHDVYTPHNMMMVSFSTIDLMCSAEFDRRELGTLRESMWHAQSMGRIGNILSTWRRELSDADYSNGLTAVLSNTDVLRLPAPAEQSEEASSSHMERRLLAKWEWHRSRCHSAARAVRSIDLTGVLEGHDRFLDMHLISTGLI